MKRLPAMQDWPLLLIRARTAVAAAAATSAEGMTMNGSDPPSSSTDFFTWSAAMEATERPAGSEPVRVTALTLASARTAATSEPPISRVRKEPSGEPCPLKERVEEERRLGHVRGMLEQAGVARHERRGGKADDLPERVVPWHDRQDGAQRLVARPRSASTDRRRVRQRGIGQEAPRHARRRNAWP